MGYKTSEQMLQTILNEGLLTDACMTILEGRNMYGFHATEVPAGSIKKMTDGAYEITVTDAGNDDLHIPVRVSDDTKETSFWLIRMRKDKPYEIFAIQHEDAAAQDIKRKEYLSNLLLFLDYYKIGTNAQLMNVLKDGYSRLKKELGEENPYELLKDYMSDEMVALKAEQMPDKFGVRIKFHPETA